MEFRHFFVKSKSLDYFYMNILRPLGYYIVLNPGEYWRYFIDRKKFSYLEKYKNMYKGQRCFIVGSGPSLKKEELEAIKDEIVMGVNSLCLLDNYKKNFDYFFISDVDAYTRLYDHLPKDTFVSDYCIRKHPELEASNFQPLPVNRYNGFIPQHRKFSFDISKIVYDFNSVTFLAIHFALYAGFKEIYLLGVDCNYTTSKIYSVDHGIRQNPLYMKSQGERMIYNFRFIKDLFDKKNIPVKIYNASTGGMLEVFPRVNLNDVLKH